MSRPCSRIMDEPVRVLGLDDEDWGVGTTLFVMLHLFGWTFSGLAAAAVSVGVLRVVKRGQPPGMVLHRLWSLGLPLVRGVPPAPPPGGQRYSPW